MFSIEWGWFGRLTPTKRAQGEVEELERGIYDAQKALHNAQSNLAHLTERRDFLVGAYGVKQEAKS